jgi:hypothetical protein
VPRLRRADHRLRRNFRVAPVESLVPCFGLETREDALLTVRVWGFLRGSETFNKDPGPHPEERREAMRLEG